MVRRDLIAERLERLRQYIKILKSIQKQDIQEFKKDPFVRGAAERYLHLSIECLLDIGNHIISDRGYRKPETYAEVFQILGEKKIITQQLLNELEGMAAFRNILVHDYLKIDPSQIYRIIQEKVKALDQLGRVYASLL
ncbi:MAG TPA: DUF86 domain-containing protein [Syntrophales bacterium]